jgi:hypothetical protein
VKSNADLLITMTTPEKSSEADDLMYQKVEALQKHLADALAAIEKLTWNQQQQQGVLDLQSKAVVAAQEERQRLLEELEEKQNKIDLQGETLKNLIEIKNSELAAGGTTLDQNELDKELAKLRMNLKLPLKQDEIPKPFSSLDAAASPEILASPTGDDAMTDAATFRSCQSLTEMSDSGPTSKARTIEQQKKASSTTSTTFVV